MILEFTGKCEFVRSVSKAVRPGDVRGEQKHGFKIKQKLSNGNYIMAKNCQAIVELSRGDERVEVDIHDAIIRYYSRLEGRRLLSLREERFEKAVAELRAGTVAVNVDERGNFDLVSMQERFA